MVVVRVLSIIGVSVMTVAIAYGLASGDFSGESAEILSLAWGKITLIDLYVGLALFGAWVAYREQNWWSTGAWWLLLIVLGNFATALYLAVAAFRSEDMGELLLGRGR